MMPVFLDHPARPWTFADLVPCSPSPPKACRCFAYCVKDLVVGQSVVSSEKLLARLAFSDGLEYVPCSSLHLVSHQPESGG